MIKTFMLTISVAAVAVALTLGLLHPRAARAGSCGDPHRKPAHSTVVATRAQEFNVTSVARESADTQLEAFAALAELHAAGVLSDVQFGREALRFINASAPVVNVLQSTPMDAHYAAARKPLVYALGEVMTLWHDAAATGTYNPLDYKLARAGLDAALALESEHAAQ